jgi:TonB family protein
MRALQAIGILGSLVVLLGVWLAGGLLFPKSKAFPKKETVRVVEADLVSPDDKKEEPEEVDKEELKQVAPVAMPDRVVVLAPSGPAVSAGPELAPMSLGDLESVLGGAGGGGMAIGGGQLGGARGFGGGGVEEQAFSLSDVDEKPKVMGQVKPNYPSDLKKQKLDGKAVVFFIVDKEGHVLQPRIVEATHPSFGQAALDAIRQWRFEPAKRDGRAAAARLQIPISFKHEA